MKTILLKRLFTWTDKPNDKRNNYILTSKYYPSEKYVLFMDSLYHRNTWHIDAKTFKTKREAQKYLLTI